MNWFWTGAVREVAAMCWFWAGYVAAALAGFCWDKMRGASIFALAYTALHALLRSVR